MKILIGIDDSVFSLAAAKEIAQRTWEKGTMVRLVSAVEPHFTEYKGTEQTNVYEVARQAVDRAVSILQSSQNDFNITTEIIEGNAKDVILDEAERWAANLIVVGSHGRRGLKRFLLGSVSQAVAMHANCSVEIVRSPATE